MVFYGRIHNSHHPLGAGMEMDVLNLNGLLVTSPMSVECLDQIELKPQQLVGVVAIHAYVLFGHVLVALAFFATLRTASKPSSAQTSAKSRIKP